MADWKVAPVQLITTAVIAMFKTALGAGARVYDSNVPPDAVFPYHMVLQIAGGGRYGPPLTNPDVDAEIVYQIDAVGSRRDQAQLWADKAVEIMLSRTASGAFVYPLVMPSGWNLCGRMPNEGEGPGGVEQEGAPPNVTYTAPNRFIVAVTPTA